MGKMVGMAEFKAHCTRLLREVSEGGEPITVTSRGKPVAVVKAPVPTRRTIDPDSLFGCLASPGYRFDDPFSPAYDGVWDAERGEWEP